MRRGSYFLPGMALSEHEFVVPLDYANPEEGSLTVFAREIVARDLVNHSLPWLVFFQGGPGFPSPRPQAKEGWLKRALLDHRVLLLDQRGTGLSSPITYQTLKHFGSAEKQAQYLKHFRADAIVRDAELIRSHLLQPGEKWTGLGQSYGGFCLTHYLSFAPEGLEAAIITGGLPPLRAHVDDVYRATYERVLVKNKRYYERYPIDVERVNNIIASLSASDVRLPDGGILTPERFQQLGIAFGMSDGFDQVHYLIEEAFVSVGAGKQELSFSFLRRIEEAQHYETNPIYALLHESIYCQNFASRWSAQRVRHEFPNFDVHLNNQEPTLFTGEMIYPFMFDQYEYLKPLKEAAEILAEYEHWAPLYDVDRLRKNTVPVAAALYYEDMYVETAFSQETADAIGNCKLWVTNEYEHNGIRADGERVLDRLFMMIRGEI